MQTNHAENVAQRKLGLSKNEISIFKWEVITEDTMLFTAGIPGIKTRGINKGDKKWSKPYKSVAVTDAEIKTEYERFEKETGKCGDCMGDGKRNIGWNHITGHKYKQCPRCKGTGVIDRGLVYPDRE